jgi:hypothetical protein
MNSNHRGVSVSNLKSERRKIQQIPNEAISLPLVRRVIRAFVPASELN